MYYIEVEGGSSSVATIETQGDDSFKKITFTSAYSVSRERYALNVRVIDAVLLCRVK